MKIASFCGSKCLIQIFLLCSGAINKVGDFKWKGRQFPSLSNIILHVTTCTKMVLQPFVHF